MLIKKLAEIKTYLYCCRQYGVGNIGLVVFSRYAINYGETLINCWGGSLYRVGFPVNRSPIGASVGYFAFLPIEQFHNHVAGRRTLVNWPADQRQSPAMFE